MRPQHIPQIIAMCERLIAGGHAYAAEGHVLFDVSSYPDYGKLSGRSTDEMIAGARVEVAPYKKNPADFVLWKPSTPDLPGWDSPWGRGRPGWHIECSAMSEAHLGETLDIHAGGNDLMFPHHENEVAQSTCAHGGKVFARWWLHNGMLTFGGRKMSKSLGNTLVLHELLERYPAELLRFMLLKAHYRQPLDWSRRDAGAGAAHARRPVRHACAIWPTSMATRARRCPPNCSTALADDLNTPEALALLARLADNARKATNPQDKKAAKAALLGAGAFLGLLQQDPEAWFKRHVARRRRCRLDRTPARRTRRRAQAQGLRRAPTASATNSPRNGVVIEDGPQGARWKLATQPEPIAMNARPDIAVPAQSDASSADDAQAAIAEEFSFFSDWTERYQYLIDLGRKLPPFPEELQDRSATRCRAASRRSGWSPKATASGSQFRAISDSAIVSGLIALLLRVYSGRARAGNPRHRAALRRSDRPGQASVADAQQWSRGDAADGRSAHARRSSSA